MLSNTPPRADDRAMHALVSAWLALTALTAAWEWTGLDLSIMRLLGNASGFAWQHHWFLSNWLHTGMRQAFVLVFLLTMAWALWPQRWQFWHDSPLWVPRQERLAALLAIAVCLMAVSLAKRASLTSCPWDLQEFGGMARYVPHWNLLVLDGGPGHCFPGGHASSALSFLPLALPWLLPLTARPARPRLGWALYTSFTATGLLLGLTQTLRGAHYPSHTLWTLLICAGLSVAIWKTLYWRSTQTAKPSQQL